MYAKRFVLMSDLTLILMLSADHWQHCWLRCCRALKHTISALFSSNLPR